MSGLEPRTLTGIMTGSSEDIADLLANRDTPLVGGCKFEHLAAVNSTNRALYSDRGKSYLRAYPENDAWQRLSITLWREHKQRFGSSEDAKR